MCKIKQENSFLDYFVCGEEEVSQTVCEFGYVPY